MDENFGRAYWQRVAGADDTELFHRSLCLRIARERSALSDEVNDLEWNLVRSREVEEAAKAREEALRRDLAQALTERNSCIAERQGQ